MQYYDRYFKNKTSKNRGEYYKTKLLVRKKKILIGFYAIKLKITK